MKKILKNTGTTLVEVVAASLILALIAVPLFLSMLQSTKTNVSSDVEIKMNAFAQSVIEKIKATGQYTDGTQYFTKNFTQVGNSSLSYYTMTVSTQTNSISNNENYDRWDFEVKMGDDGKATIYQNNGSSVLDPNGKLYSRSLVPGTSGIDLTQLQFLGERATLTPKYIMKYEGAFNVPFTPGTGSNSKATDNTIVLNIYRSNAASGTITINNSTCYSDDGFTSIKYDSNNLIMYQKQIIVNIFNDNTTTPNIKIIPVGPYIDINYKNEDSPLIRNGDKIVVTFTNPTGKIVKTITSVSGKKVS